MTHEPRRHGVQPVGVVTSWPLRQVAGELQTREAHSLQGSRGGSPHERPVTSYGCGQVPARLYLTGTVSVQQGGTDLAVR